MDRSLITCSERDYLISHRYGKSGSEQHQISYHQKYELYGNVITELRHSQIHGTTYICSCHILMRGIKLQGLSYLICFVCQ
ncbi:unnamed protein product [Allacma fusca]|uniref:Uncharacterized protein n=1 Tax=Allacma fusca TaxID=39272 RepID=A0A8J2NVM3_9HEXA|nr:unnamed protein product [Allacma fusca]